MPNTICSTCGYKYNDYLTPEEQQIADLQAERDALKEQHADTARIAKNYRTEVNRLDEIVNCFTKPCGECGGKGTTPRYANEYDESGAEKPYLEGYDDCPHCTDGRVTRVVLPEWFGNGVEIGYIESDNDEFPEHARGKLGIWRNEFDGNDSHSNIYATATRTPDGMWELQEVE